MALQAGVDTDRNTLTDMAIVTAGRVRFMQDIANQPFVVTPVRTVAAATTFHLGRVADMLRLDDLGRMTFPAKLVGSLDEQGSVGRLMGIMAGRTFPLGIGCVGKLERPRQSGVAGEAGLRRTGLEQIGLFRRMGVVTGKALPFPNRSMNDRLLQILAHLRVTGIAQLGDLPLQHAGVAGHVRVVTGAARPFCHRIMLDPLLKIGPLVTGKAVNSGRGCARDKETQSQQA